MKTISSKKDENDEYYLDMKDLLEGLTTRPSTVKYYSLIEREDKSIILTLFNKNKKKIVLKERK